MWKKLWIACATVSDKFKTFYFIDTIYIEMFSFAEDTKHKSKVKVLTLL